MIGTLLRGVLAGAILSGTPLLYATLGEVITGAKPGRESEGEPQMHADGRR